MKNQNKTKQKKSIYIDTNTISDAIEDRTNEFGENIGKYAYRLFWNCKGHGVDIVISEWTLEELFRRYNPQDLQAFFAMFKDVIKRVKSPKSEEGEAEKRSSVHPDDARHIIIAEREKVDIIATSNIAHFLQIGSHILIKKPKHISESDLLK